MSIGYIKQSAASVPTPPVGEQNTFIDSADDKLKKKLDDGSIVDLEGTAAGVATFEGRSGVVVGVAGDYTASEVTNVPAGNLIAITVQAAINELDTEKAPLTHVGAGGPSEHPVVTNVVAGFMSPADKVKLDNLSTDVGFDLYRGTWNATTNVPTIVSSVGTKGDRYVVATAGSTVIDGISDWNIGDWIIFNGVIWEQVDNTDAVASVNGYVGTVVLVKGDVGLGNVDNTSDANKPVSTATQTALNGKADNGDAIDQLTGDVVAGPGGGSQAATIPNAVVTAKVLTGFTELHGKVAATDSILESFEKLSYTGNMHPIAVNSDITIPADYNLIRGQTKLTGTAAIIIGLNGMLKII